MPEWRTENPDTEGEYLVTFLDSIMVDSRSGPHSYAYCVGVAYFYGNGWSRSNVVAWAKLPAPYVPKKKGE